MIDTNHYKGFKAPNVTSPKVALTESEVSDIYTLNLSLKRDLSVTRDIFLFGVFTGLKFSDIMQLRPCDVHDGKITVYDFVHCRNWQIPFNNYARMILKRYEGSERNLCFPTLNPVFANKQVKEIAQMAKINSKVISKVAKNGEIITMERPKYEMITLDTARFSYAALSLLAGMRPELLMLILGQKNI